MLIVKPMPEEFAAGHAGRWLNLNTASRSGVSGLAMNVSDLSRRHYGVREPSPVHTLAKMCGLTVEDYACKHTLMRFHAFASQTPDAERPECWRVAQYKRFGLSTLKQPVRLCAACIRDDRAAFGFAYWRRGHQCPGAVWCREHKKPLRQIDVANAFMYTPDHWVEASHLVPGFQSKRPPVALVRYHETVEWMCTHGLPMPASALSMHLVARAKEKAIPIASYSNDHRLLSDHAWRALPEAWLHNTFPRAKNKVLGLETASLDAVLESRSSQDSQTRGTQVGAAAIALALSILYRTQAELLSSLQRPLHVVKGVMKSTAARSSPAGRRSEFSSLGWTMMSRAFLDHAGDYKAMAKTLNVSEEQVRQRTATFRLKLLEGLRRTPEYRALLQFLGGRSLQEVCASHGIETRVMEALLRLMHRKANLSASDPAPGKSDQARADRADRRYQEITAQAHALRREMATL